jgi:hypothetical protein
MSSGTFNGVLLIVASGGGCTGGDTVRFVLTPAVAAGSNIGTLQTSSNPPAAGSYHVCVEAFEQAVSPFYAAINITVN